jgi:hypothetical protein
LLVLSAERVQSVFKNDLLALRRAEGGHDVADCFGSGQAHARSGVLKNVPNPQVCYPHDELLVPEKMVSA